MSDIDKHAAKLVESLHAFRDQARSTRPQATESLANLDSLLCSLANDFNLDLADPRGQKRSASAEPGIASKLKREMRSQRSKLEKLQSFTEESLGSKLHGYLRKAWYLRAGLSNPSVPARTLSEFCRDFPLVKNS